MVNLTSVLKCQKYFQTRSSFKLPDRSILNWYPGHMYTGFIDMQKKLRNIDCIIEVHDARIPLSGRNPRFSEQICSVRPHILVLNKMDLADPNLYDVAADALKSQGSPRVIYTNSKDQQCAGVKRIIHEMVNIFSSSNRFNRSEEKEFTAMIIGVPNVGKSSLINTLRNRNMKKQNAVKVGAVAGVTKAVGERVKILESPPIYIYDTPGILQPSIPNVEVGMKLALCAIFKDTDIGFHFMADYLLYWLNKNNNYCYISYLDLKEPSDNIDEVLVLSAIAKKYFRKSKHNWNNGSNVVPDTDKAAYSFVNAFRRGIFGEITLDGHMLS
ncbi:mitochondrial GTPase 1 [Nilaparvata lugens]|uniref:mitochondrial GTPase 1 n=1 Tax=Nilaparvata lugens TaxID=108931 RepID=UPI00193E5DC3|nr:mitochondrial GTPase 1 [Nilaparvata lugens]